MNELSVKRAEHLSDRCLMGLLPSHENKCLVMLHELATVTPLQRENTHCSWADRRAYLIQISLFFLKNREIMN